MIDSSENLTQLDTRSLAAAQPLQLRVNILDWSQRRKINQSIHSQPRFTQSESLTALVKNLLQAPNKTTVTSLNHILNICAFPPFPSRLEPTRTTYTYLNRISNQARRVQTFTNVGENASFRSLLDSNDTSRSQWV